MKKILIMGFPEPGKTYLAEALKKYLEEHSLMFKSAETVVGKWVWEVYRQNLRDVPSQAGFPHDITWPEKP